MPRPTKKPAKTKAAAKPKAGPGEQPNGSVATEDTAPPPQSSMELEPPRHAPPETEEASWAEDPKPRPAKGKGRDNRPQQQPRQDLPQDAEEESKEDGAPAPAVAQTPGMTVNIAKLQAMSMA